MSKHLGRTRFTTKPPRVSETAILLFRGIVISLLVSLICTLFLSVVNLVTENTYIDNYIQYIMVSVTMVSIFIGSAYVAHHASSKRVILGMLVSVIYVLISVGFGMEMSQDPISLFVLANKFVAGILVGILGGLVGVNL